MCRIVHLITLSCLTLANTLANTGHINSSNVRSRSRIDNKAIQFKCTNISGSNTPTLKLYVLNIFLRYLLTLDYTLT